MPAGNANYTYDQIFAIEQKMSGSFYDVASPSHIVVAMIALSGRLNKGFKLWESPKGLKAIVPLLVKEGVTEGVTRSGMYAPQAGIGQTDEDTFEFAEYPFTTLRGGFQLDWRQGNFLNNRGFDNMDAEIKRIRMGFAKNIETQIVGLANAAEDNVLGLRYWLPDTPSTSTNKPGNFDYASNAWWRPQVTDWNAAITLAMLTRMLVDTRRDAITVEDGLQQANLILLGETTEATTGTRLYSKVVDAFVNVQRIVQNDKLLSLGYTDHIEYMGAVIHPLKGDVDTAVGAPSGMSGLAFALNTSTIFFGGGIEDLTGSLSAQMLPPVRPPKTSVTDYQFILPVVEGLMDPARNAKYRRCS